MFRRYLHLAPKIQETGTTTPTNGPQWSKNGGKNSHLGIIIGGSRYFPYCLVEAIASAFRRTFPGSAKQLEPADEFSDYINALVSELFVHQSGSTHGGNLRSVMRKNLFKEGPGSGGGGTSGTGRRRLRRRRTHRWMDIAQPDGGDAEQASPVVIASRSVSIAQQPPFSDPPISHCFFRLLSLFPRP